MSTRPSRLPEVVLLLMLVAATAAIVFVAGCGFHHATTPAGIACADIPLVGRGDDVRMYTRRRACTPPPWPTSPPASARSSCAGSPATTGPTQ